MIRGLENIVQLLKGQMWKSAKLPRVLGSRKQLLCFLNQPCQFSSNEMTHQSGEILQSWQQRVQSTNYGCQLFLHRCFMPQWAFTIWILCYALTQVILRYHIVYMFWEIASVSDWNYENFPISIVKKIGLSELQVDKDVTASHEISKTPKFVESKLFSTGVRWKYLGAMAFVA